MPWVYNEDAALKFKLQGLTVIDANALGGRRVPVRFRLPEDELATLSYPMIVIEHLGINPAPEREHRGFIQLGYAPEGYANWFPDGVTQFDPTQSPYYSYFPLPYNLDYQVTVYARKMPEHLQPLIATLATDPYLPYHFGYLNIPQDGTIRNMFLMTGPQIEYGKDNDDKRLFRASYMVRVMTEVIPEVFTNGVYNALADQINLDLGCYSDVSNLTTEEITSNQAIISTGPKMTFNVGLTQLPPGMMGRPQPLPTLPLPRRKTARGYNPRVWR
jgi:hypothetical protein